MRKLRQTDRFGIARFTRVFVAVGLTAVLLQSNSWAQETKDKKAVPETSCEKPAAEKKDPYAWQELFDGKTLKGWKVPEFGGEGEVTVKDGTIVMEMGNSMTGITFAGKPPKNNYELLVEGSRLDGSDFFATTTFPVGENCCSLVTGGWGGTVVGLSCIDFYDASDNFTTKFFDFKDKQWYTFRIRVTDAKIQAWIGDEQFVDQPRKGHRIGIRDEVDLCQPLGVSSWDTKAALRKIRIRRLKPAEIKAEAAAAAKDEDK
ncbi:MAG: DUF1080 domain-containing protein [Thermoguttaceae bacterium]